MKQLNKTLNIRRALIRYFSYIGYDYMFLNVSFDKKANDYRITTEDCTAYLKELFTDDNLDRYTLSRLIRNK